jgi:hypothetical protein
VTRPPPQLAGIQAQRHVLLTSSIVAAELCYGARTLAMPITVRELLAAVQILAFTAGDVLRVAYEVQRA